MTATNAIADSTLTPATPTHPEWAFEPFAFGTDEDFRRLREFLLGAGFSEEGIRAAAGFQTTYHFVRFGHPDRTVLLDPTDKLTLLVQLFLDGRAFSSDFIDEVLAPDERALLDRFKLLHPNVNDPATLVTSIALYPLENVYIVSDRFPTLQTMGEGIPSDIVYTPLTNEARRFIHFAPRRAFDDYLELCAGTGVAALIAGKNFARRATAIDITERSTRFAQFNARLNGLANVRAVAGDLYAPVAGQQFDAITAHPPYVASFDNDMIYRDGGEDGEQISRAIIAGLVDHLRPGGVCYCDCTMTDRQDAPLEQRLRAMLGPRHEEFDIILGQSGSLAPVNQYAGGVVEGRSTPELFARRIRTFQRLGITSFVSAQIAIHRHATTRPPITRRRLLTGRTTRNDFEWLQGYVVATAAWTDADVLALLETTPRLVDGTEWRTRMLAENGEWRMASTLMATTAPFLTEADDCPPWFAQLAVWCDGRTSGHELLRRCREQQFIPAGDDLRFAQLIRQFADGGFVELPQFPLPRR